MTWLRDLLLDSPVPPSRWMPDRTARLADARMTLRRRFGLAEGRVARPAHRLQDLAPTHLPVASSTRYVSGEEIEADLEADITSVNPPVIQGWGCALLVPAAIASLAGLGLAFRSGTEVGGLGLAVGALLAWALSLVVWGAGQHAIELDELGVKVRRWPEVWLRRPGRRLGPPEGLRATLPHPWELAITGAAATTRMGLRTWGPTALADLVDELPLWGVDCTFEPHHHRRGKGRRQRRRRAGDPRSGGERL